MADDLINRFTSEPVDSRSLLNSSLHCPIDDKKFRQTYKDMKSGGQDSRTKTIKPVVCDFKSSEEVKALHRAFGYRCMICGLPSNKIIPSADKILLTGRYNWTDNIIMHC